MTKYILVIALLLFFVPSPASAQNQPEVVRDQLVVKYKDGQSPDDLKRVAQRREENRKRPVVGPILNTLENFALRVRGQKPPESKLSELEAINSRVGVLEEENLLPAVDDDIKVYRISGSSEEARNIYSSSASVEYSALDYRLAPPPLVPNDPYYPRMWNLTKIQADLAWDIAPGTREVLVGSIDTGIDYTHEDLPRDIINGRDFGSGDDDSMDTYPHGTQVAGIISAVINNNRGVAGISPNVRLLAVNVYAPDGLSSYFAVAQGTVYAADRGAKVIYLEVQSYPGLPCTDMPYLQEAIDYARSKGAVIVTAAGNFDSDARTISPASCTGQIVVGASNQKDQGKSYSNWGEPVDIAAPADSIITTSPGNTYTLYFGGTSAATPHVAAAAALLLSINPNLSADEVERIIKETGDPISTDKPIGGKRLNVYKALLAISNQVTPTPSTTVTPTPTPTPTSTPPSPTPTPTRVLIPTDINRDGCVGLADFERWRHRFVNNITAAGEPADVNQDGVIDLLDYNEWFSAMQTLPSEQLCRQ